MPAEGPDFLKPVPHNGYAWWYIDALSDDRAHGLTIIAFIGSVFSPYYAWARRRGEADPANHCAINVALYGRSGKRWAMTERAAPALARSTSHLAIGNSSLAWDGRGLAIDINEVTVPFPSRLRGKVRVIPQAINPQTFTICGHGDHNWRPIAPLARIELAFSSPVLSWSGQGYFDHNFGAAPLEDAFSFWTWSRSVEPGATTIFYDVATAAQVKDQDINPPLALRFDRAGNHNAISDVPAPANLGRTRWGIARATRCDEDATPKVVETLEDAPFYTRSVVQSTVHGARTVSMHESLSLKRFSSPIVQAMLPFKMPRRAR